MQALARAAALAPRAAALARPLATAAGPAASPDRFLLKGLVFHGYHGVYKEERVLGQKFVVDASLSTSLREAGETDDLTKSVSYADVYDTIRAVVEGEPCLLVERVAETIARDILKAYPSVSSATISVTKPHVAVTGVVGALGIEITRTQADY